jgi:signal transduction histidine kinase
VLDARPEAASELLEHIEGSSRDAVVELQRLLGLLRQEGDADDDGPQPGLAALPVLAEQLRDAGVAVDVDLDGAASGDVPPAVALSAYRIVQEALTNTLKHAGPGSRATVEVRRSPSSLELVVADDGAAVGGTSTGDGHGLVGMRERVRLHGGELKVGRAATGGFEVRAWFPL